MWSRTPCERKCAEAIEKSSAPQAELYTSLEHLSHGLLQQFNNVNRKHELFTRKHYDNVKHIRDIECNLTKSNDFTGLKALPTLRSTLLPVRNSRRANFQALYHRPMIHLGTSWLTASDEKGRLDPTTILYTPPNETFDTICTQCKGFFRRVDMIALPPGWSEHNALDTNRTYYYHEGNGSVLWSPPPEASRLSKIVFQEHATVFQLCTCPMPREKRIRLLHRLSVKAKEVSQATMKERRAKMNATMAAMQSIGSST